MLYVAGLGKVALDTTVVRHFHDAGQLTALVVYLRDNAYAAEDVHRELNLQSRIRQEIAKMQNQFGWPKHFGGQLPRPTIHRGLQIQASWLEPGDPPDAHLGEIYTVLAAKHFNADLVITNDRDGFNLARSEEIEVIRAGELIAEMVAEGRIGEQVGWDIYRPTRKKPKRSNYDQLLKDARNAKALRSP
jgi:hypothetical protein